MSIRPVDFGMVQRLQDVSQIKQNEIARPAIEQQNIENKMEKQIIHRAEQVNEKEDVKNEEGHFDAREESSNKYFGKNHSKKEPKEQNEDEDGTVAIKGKGGFDVKI